jgi:hypothetical protein
LSKNSWSNHRSAHILGIGVSEFLSADGDVVTLARQLRSQGALAIAAHPVSTRKFEPQTYHLWHRREELRQEFDAWEVASGAVIFDEVRTSGLPMVASSDLHHAKQINAWKTELYCERNTEAIIDAIRRQDVSFKFYSETEAGFVDRAHQPLSRRPGFGDLVGGHWPQSMGNLGRVSALQDGEIAVQTAFN